MFNWWWSNKIAVFDITIAENGTILQYNGRHSNKMAMANVKTILRWQVLEQNWGNLPMIVPKCSGRHSNKMSCIWTKFPTFEQNVLHSNKMSCIQTKWHTFEQNVLHSNKMTCIQTKCPSFEQNILHSNKMAYVRTKCRTSHSQSFRLHASRNIVIVSRISISRGGSLGFGD